MFLKKAESDGKTIKFNDSIKALQMTLNDVKADPYDVVKLIFMLLLDDKNKLSMDNIQ